MTRYAKDEKCVKCKKPAVCYWPAYDPDIPSHPYCRKCKDAIDLELLMKFYESKPTSEENNKHM